MVVALAFPHAFAADTSTPLASGGSTDSTTACYTAVYDQQNGDGTYAHYAKGEWDASRQLCIHAKGFTKQFLANVTAIKAAQSNPLIHVMYVIDRTTNRLYAPCGANIDAPGIPGGVLPPGTYDLGTLTKVDAAMPSLGSGADCLITGV